MENIDVQAVGLGGVIGSLVLAAIQYGIARLSGLKSPVLPAPVPVPQPQLPAPTLPMPVPVPQAPVPPLAVPVAVSPILMLLEAVAVEYVRARFAGTELPPGLKAAMPALRNLLDVFDPPAK